MNKYIKKDGKYINSCHPRCFFLEVDTSVRAGDGKCQLLGEDLEKIYFSYDSCCYQKKNCRELLEKEERFNIEISSIELMAFFKNIILKLFEGDLSEEKVKSLFPFIIREFIDNYKEG